MLVLFYQSVQAVEPAQLEVEFSKDLGHLGEALGLANVLVEDRVEEHQDVLQVEGQPLFSEAKESLENYPASFLSAPTDFIRFEHIGQLDRGVAFQEALLLFLVLWNLKSAKN